MEKKSIQVPFIIAEIGCNHKGNLSIAKEMIKMAAEFCKVDAVKFQKRSPKELLSPCEYYSPHPAPEHAYGNTYGEHREALEFTVKQHLELTRECKKYGVAYSSSVWDITSARDIISLKPAYVKIPSACNLNFKLLDFVVRNFKGNIHLSFGMTSPKEEKLIINFFHKKKRLKNLVIYSCVSAYPVDFEQVSLLDVKRINDAYGNKVNAIGFSGHHLGIAADIAAFTLGATYIERHFTLDRTWKGTDHAASLEPDGLRRLARDLRNISKALSYKSKPILDIEFPQRKKLKKILYEKN